ncbi:MAG: right-handed parallel beta-helix repeat-containing protein [Promethearchaeota archaeon]
MTHFPNNPRYFATYSCQSTSVNGYISENTTWTLTGSPYIVVGDVTVVHDVFLTIEPGVVVKFANNTSLVVDGSLVAQGNFTHKITFTCNHTTPQPRIWRTIRVRSQANISYAIIQYSHYGITFYQSGNLVDCSLDHLSISSNYCGISFDTELPSTHASIDLDSIEVTNSSYAGICFFNGYGFENNKIRNSVISHNARGIQTYSYGSGYGRLSVTNCTISNNTRWGMDIRDSDVDIYNCTIVNNLGICPQDPTPPCGSGYYGDGAQPFIQNSVISNNAGHGVYVKGGGYSEGSPGTRIYSSSISHNGQSGVTCNYLDIRSSNITHNDGNGVVANQKSDVHYCNLNDNLPYNMKVTLNYPPYNATYNWWGTSNETLIEEYIYDYYDYSSLGVVNYAPFLNSSASTPYSLTVDPTFYDHTGTAVIQPSLWSIRFSNDTVRTVSSSVTYNQTQIGEYSIVSIIWKGVEVIPETTPTTLLTSDKLWSPSINCLLPTNLAISLSSSISYVGFQVEIDGNLTCNELGLSGAPILLSYSVTGGASWNDITLVDTASDGSYSALWMPSATGNYLVRATWAGNATYPGTSTTVNLAVTQYEEQYVFSVESNSTISGLTFNTTNWQLSFTTTGPNGTRGYARVTISKSLVANITNIRVHLDGNQSEYSTTSTDDSWLLTLTYAHSAHKVVVDLNINIIPHTIGYLKSAWKDAALVLGTSDPYGPLPWGALIDDTVGAIDLAAVLGEHGNPTSAFDVEVAEWTGTIFRWKLDSPSAIIAVGGTAVNLVSYEYNSLVHFSLGVTGDYVELTVDADGIDYIRLYFTPSHYVIHYSNGSEVEYDSEENDFAEAYAYYDSVNEKYVFLVMGMCAEGTVGACRYLATNLASFPTDVANAQGIILHWYDADGDGIAKTNEMTPIATYP